MTEYMKVDEGGGRQSQRPVNYPSNSRKGKEARTDPDPPVKRAEKIVEGTVVQRKKGFGHRFTEALLGEGGMEGAIDAFITDILVAAFKGMISDAIGQVSSSLRDGVDRFLYGDSRGRTGRVHTSYNTISRSRTARPEYGVISQRARTLHDFDDVVLQTRGEAEDVLDELRNRIEAYGVVAVSDFYDLCGITGNWTDEKWGWEDLVSARIRPVRGGYLISLPRPKQID
jgi:hypothetical protein